MLCVLVRELLRLKTVRIESDTKRTKTESFLFVKGQDFLSANFVQYVKEKNEGKLCGIAYS